ncbi:MAG: tripartite tricarboxylate transporter substrate binding protein [Methylococcaceae bacterium]|jgi:tripartite-type tricarboxylate transporter receptor subunit TctC|nr:tripartite tricarboxylate transporter substrate binding protein [Methylococcaceae bacterium]
MKKKSIALLGVLLMSICLLAGWVGAQEKYPTKPINLIVPFGPGGGTDVGARILAPFVEKELGVPVNIINKAGAAGWVGWTELLNSAPDGYTIGFIASPSLVPGYLDPQFKRTKNLEDFDLIANQVLDPGVIAINPQEKRFTNLKELIAYAQKNETTCAQDGVGSDDWMALMRFNKQYNTKFTNVATKSTAESLTALMGAHVDTVFANVGELKVPHDGKQVKVIAVMQKERSPFFPDIPCVKELGYEVYSSSSRGVAAPKGLKPEVKEKLVSAFEKGINNPEHISKMKGMGLDVVFMKGDQFKNHIKNDEKIVLEVKWW